ncbi:MAG TPA: hypothetical protein ENI69_09605, partial [Rhodospirillales bacterium]|nr:hypothetical protein [Rhodospirillales bacterium]
MRAVLINHCHPQMDHVCAVRMATFATAMAQRGHQIVLLSGAGSGHVSIADHRTRMANHDWSSPYTLPCKPAPAPLLERLHQGRLPSGIRQAVVAVSYLLQGGVFYNWRRGADDAINFLASDFKPDIAWATFGNTDAWNIGRDLAQRAGCPWVADMKDNWDHYIPGPFRSWLSGRYGTAAGFTALSRAHGDLVSRRFGTAAQVIYSGFGNPQEAPSEAFRLVISGSIYDGQMLAVMVKGIRTWLQDMRTETRVEVCYFGNDWKMAERVLAPLDAYCRVVSRSFLAPAELAPLLAGATAILY